MGCNCNKPKNCCGNIPVRTCCSNPTAVTRTEFYDYKNNVSTDLDAINRDLENKELKIAKLDLGKQNKLLAGDNIILTENADQTVTISATDGGGSTYTAGDGITIASDEISVNDTIQRKLTAGENIAISASNEISAVGTHYEVGAEVKIGTWTESGTTYDVCRKVVDFGALPNAGDKDVSHGITDAVKFINLYAIADDGTNIRPIPFTSGTAATNQITLYANRTSVHIHAGTDRSDENAYVTIEYLKIIE